MVDAPSLAPRDCRPAPARDDPVIGGIAEAHGQSTAQVMLRWGVQHGRSVIPMSTKPGRIAESLNVFFDLSAVVAPPRRS